MTTPTASTEGVLAAVNLNKKAVTTIRIHNTYSILRVLKEFKFSQITVQWSSKFLLALLGAHNTYTYHTSWSSKYTQHTSIASTVWR